MLTRVAEWFGRQVTETKRYFNLADKSKTSPPAIVWLAGGLVILVIILLVCL